MIVVLLVSTGAAWETDALAALNEHPGTVVLKRCVDGPDLLAAASTGQADVAVLAADLPGLDHRVVDELGRHGLRVLGIAATPDTQTHGMWAWPAARVGELADLLTQGPDQLTPTPRRPPEEPAAHGRVIAVWGPGGAPGRTTLASALAGELGRRGPVPLLVDADPYGGTVAQQLGILDERSGLLAAARLVADGDPLGERFDDVQRCIGDRVRVLTGLPRPDRWAELRPGVLVALLERARRDGPVVVDTGFSVEPDASYAPGRPERNGLTREALEASDEIVVVGTADPVGLSRLARAHAELCELLPERRATLVVNRMRSSLGWHESDVVALLRRLGAPDAVHVLPDDQPATDRAVVAGRLLVESGDSALRRAVSRLVDALAVRS
jgi:MinD-like ATPase involved in chromosome partitioning or flagellar assembly